jgi:hypothetical protein
MHVAALLYTPSWDDIYIFCPIVQTGCNNSTPEARKHLAQERKLGVYDHHHIP